MRGPSGAGYGRHLSALVLPRKNCHQMKNAVEPTNSTSETHAFTRSPASSCAGSMRSSSSKKRPNV